MKAKAVRDVITGLIVYSLLIFFLIISVSLPSAASLYPKIIIGIFGFLNTIMLINAGKVLIRSKEKMDISDLKFSFIPLYLFGMAVIYVILFKMTNYYISTAIMMVALMLFFKIRSVLKIGSVIIGYSLFTYILFTWQLNVPL